MQAAVDLVVLAGGTARRLGAMGQSCPKPLLPVAGLPFLAYPLEAMAKTVRLRRVVITVRKDARHHFVQLEKYTAYPVHIVEENKPMGTGGAILGALESARLSNPFLVINGDVLFEMNGAALLAAAQKTGAALAGVMVANAARFGCIEPGVGGTVARFAEKTGIVGPGLINAGAYAFTHESLIGLVSGPCSFEYDIAPVLAAQGRLGLVEENGPFLDIGTPESWLELPGFMADWQGRIKNLA